MVNYNKTIAGLCALSVLGLFSCSSDKVSDDGWKLSEPRIESQETGLSSPVTQAPLQNLPNDSVLIFNTDELDGNAVQIQSVCHSPNGLVKETKAYRRQNQFKIKNLWPKALWSTLSSEKLVLTSCDFTFSVSHGNVVHDFTLTSTRLNSFLRSELTAKVRNAGANLDSEAQAKLFATEVIQSLPIEGCLALICDSYQASVDQILNEIELQSLLQQTWKLKASDPRILQPTQDCHFVKSADGHGFEITPTFRYQFAPKALLISAKSGMSAAHSGNWRNLNIFTLLIKNESEVPSAFAVPADLGSVRLRLVTRHNVELGLPLPLGSLVLGSRILREPLQFFSSKEAAASSREEQIFVLQPGEEIEVGANLNSSANCYADASADPNTFLQSRNMGLMYGFEKKIRLTQFKDWSTALTDAKSERVELVGNEILPQTDSIPTRFEPSQAYLHTVGNLPLPPMMPEYPKHHNFLHTFPTLKRVYEGPGNFCHFERLTYIYKLPKIGISGSKLSSEIEIP